MISDLPFCKGIGMAVYPFYHV